VSEEPAERPRFCDNRTQTERISAMTRAPLPALTLLLLALAGCQAAPTRPLQAEPAAAAPAVEAAPAGPAANDNLNAVAWMQASLEYRLLAGQAWRGALVQLDKAIKTPGWDALTKEERATPINGLPPAIIVDVDETVLDNSPYQARLVRDDKRYDEFTWAQWVKEEAARPVPGAVEFARAAAARGVTVFYVTNRAEDLTAATISNLKKAGFPIKDESQVLGLGMVVDGCESEGSEKGCRRQLVGRTHRVLLQFGDQVGDFVTITANTPAGREQAVRPYLGWIGERWFVLPNPSYGSWEPALFNNAWSRPEAERRQDKLDALRY
jgi:5'-nucleotidase (lipoprotein e(P4) family)